MILFPNAKINLGLYILHKRKDGYHELQTVFYPVKGLTDALEVIVAAEASQQNDVMFTVSGLTVQGNEEDNLCIKAYRLLKKDFADLPKIKMHLNKVIPMGAGLGGGSSDGAAALKLLNDTFNLGLTAPQLLDYALQLGSDCPFFIINESCYAESRGEKLSQIECSLEAYKMIVVHPGIHVSTAEAFTSLQRTINYENNGEDLRIILHKPITDWKDQLINDFQAPVIKAHPEIGTIIDALYEQGALYASLSGSGSAVYGIFEKNANPLFHFPAHYFVKTLK